MLSVAYNAITAHPELKKVVIMEHSPRFDETDVDPTGIKPLLVKYANDTLVQMLQSSPMKDKLVLGKHKLDCAGDKMAAMYRDGWSDRFDGVHMYGRQGRRAFTSSVLEIIKSALSTPHDAKTASSSYHSSCPQTQYMNKQKKKTVPSNQHNQNIYTVPVKNQFDILGN